MVFAEEMTNLNVWKRVFQKFDGALGQTIRVERLFSCLCLQMLRCLHITPR